MVGEQDAVSGNSIVYEQSVLWNKLYYRVDAKHSLLFGTIVVVVIPNARRDDYYLLNNLFIRQLGNYSSVSTAFPLRTQSSVIAGLIMCDFIKSEINGDRNRTSIHYYQGLIYCPATWMDGYWHMPINVSKWWYVRYTGRLFPQWAVTCMVVLGVVGKE